MKRKFLSVFLLAVFLVSLFPAALAQENLNTANRDSTNTVNRDATLTDSESDLQDTDGAKKSLSDRAQKVTGTIKATETDLDKKPKKLLIKARKIDRNLVERYTNVRNAFIKAKQLQVASRENFAKAKLRLQECQEEDAADCGQVRGNIQSKAKNFLGNSGDAIIRHLEKIKNKIQTNTRLTEEEASDMISEIDAKITEIEDAKAKAESAETKKEVIAAAKAINAAWKPIRNRALYWSGRLINARMGGIVVKMDHLENRLKKAVDKMEEKGKDVSGIDAMVDEFHELLVSAKDNFDQSKEKYKQFKETNDKAYLTEGKKYMNLARNDLVAAHKKLKEIVRAIKAAKGADELSEAAEETPIEETEEEED